MSDKTSIEWATATWNPIRGQNARHTCARISPGCDNCYAATMTRRGLCGTAPIDYGRGETPNDPSRLDETALLQPFKWKEPRTIFVCSMTDLFGTWVPDEWIDRIFGVMALTPWHTYQVLTKRPSRMHEYMTRLVQGAWAGRYFVDGQPGTDVQFRQNGVVCELFKVTPPQVLNRASAWQDERYPDGDGFCREWPLSNVWMGTSIESDQYVWRANKLRETPAAVRWISAEPLLSGLPSLDLTGIDWLVAGGESGPGSRPLLVAWLRELRDRCETAGTAYFVKQLGTLWARENGLGANKGGDIEAFPPDLRIRQMPNAAPDSYATGVVS